MRIGEANVANSWPGDEAFLPTRAWVGTGPLFGILFDLIEFVGGLVVPG